jgi:hypothetical protein
MEKGSVILLELLRNQTQTKLDENKQNRQCSGRKKNRGVTYPFLKAVGNYFACTLISKYNHKYEYMSTHM